MVWLPRLSSWCRTPATHISGGCRCQESRNRSQESRNDPGPILALFEAPPPLPRKVDEVADDIRTRRAIENLPVLCGYTETRHKAKSWDRERRTVARIEATMLGLDIRFVVTNLDIGSAE